MPNHLKDQISPYLLQHANNPVDWYPWCPEAFLRAKKEDKPIFLSIGYSTCHWCHVMAHESFEDEEIAAILNRSFIAVKVDREERPDIDHIYMEVCQAFTGSGGWPMSVFLTAEQKPFFAGTYFPKTAAYGRIGLKELLLQVEERWQTNRERLVTCAEEIVSVLQKNTSQKGGVCQSLSLDGKASRARLLERAVMDFQERFDERFGGFGSAPKFPTPHNLLFLMRYYEKYGVGQALYMAEKTLQQMYRGGMFDHIGGGFCRYSTDASFLVPHFEKMLYDNALLILAYCKAYQLTDNDLYVDVAKRTADFILREMTDADGGFYSAQDADSGGVEGKYYLFEPADMVHVLGEGEGRACSAYFDITEHGNFEGKNIPNLLCHDASPEGWHSYGDRKKIDAWRAALYEYRRVRYTLNLDDKILTAWNALMIAALCSLYRVSEQQKYLDAAVGAWKFIREHLCQDTALYASFRKDCRGAEGFLNDYAFLIYALLALYEATLDRTYLQQADEFCRKVIADFYDGAHGGFYLYGKHQEQLVLCPKETYDGAIFSGNSAMAYNLVKLSYLTKDDYLSQIEDKQIAFMSAEAEEYPTGYAMFLLALLEYVDAPDQVTIVTGDARDIDGLPCRIPLDMLAVLEELSEGTHSLKNGRTTYYVCKGHSCLSPTNELGNMIMRGRDEASVDKTGY